jgi:hypothetical protein
MSGKTSGILYQRWPKAPALAAIWYAKVKRKDLSLPDLTSKRHDHVVCSDHFTDDCFEVESSLKATAYGREPRRSIKHDAIPKLIVIVPADLERNESKRRKREATVEKRTRKAASYSLFH